MGVTSLGKDHTWEINLAARAAWMSYVGDMTQSEIATRLGVSSARVHRLLQLAKQHGIIRISVEGRPAECMHLEAVIGKRFGLKSCTISPYLSDYDDRSDLAALSVGQAAGQVLAQHLLLPKTKSIAIDPFGNVLSEGMRSLPQFAKPKLKAWPTQGCLASQYQSIASEVLNLLEIRTGAEIGVLPAPFLPNSIEEFENFVALPSIQSALQNASKADLIVGQIQQADITDELTQPNVAKIISGTSAKSRFLGSYFDSNGKLVDEDQIPNTIAMPVNSLLNHTDQSQKRVFALAAGTEKKDALLSVLHSKIVTDLVIDEPLAKQITE